MGDGRAREAIGVRRMKSSWLKWKINWQTFVLRLTAIRTLGEGGFLGGEDL